MRFLGYTIYRAKIYTSINNKWNLASGAFNYAKKIPGTISTYIPEQAREHLTTNDVREPIGGTSIMYDLVTMANYSQKYRAPLWEVPDADLEQSDISTIRGSISKYREQKNKYEQFAQDLLSRISKLG